jgi:outer membrane protein TolC
MNRIGLRTWIPALALCVVPAARPWAQSPPVHLTLKRAIQLAIQNSPELAAARIQTIVAENQTRTDHSNFLPDLSTGTGAAYTNGFPLGTPTVFGLSYAQTIFNPPLRGQFRADQSRTAEERLAMDQVRDNVIVRSAADYLELLQVRSSLGWLRKERESAQKVLDVVQERVGAGIELPIEITKAELSRAKIEQQYVEKENREAELEDDLCTLTGLPAGQAVELADETLPPPLDLPTARLVSLALERDPAVGQAQQERAAREHLLRGERGGYWPSLALVGQYSVFSKTNNYQEFYRKFERNNVSVGVRMDVPIFRARTAAAVALAQSQLQVADLQLENQRRQTGNEVRREVRKNRELDADREVARLELKLAQQNLAVVESQYEQGRANLATLENARLDESARWLGFLSADFDRQRGELDLLKTTGQLSRIFQ